MLLAVKIYRIKLFFLIYLSFSLSVVSETKCREPCEDQDCFDLIPEDYKKYTTPRTSNGEPLAVNFSLTIFDLDEINTESMDFRMHGYVHSTWTDERLTMNGSEVNNGKCSSHIWTPDVVFETAKSSQIFGSTYLHITLDKTVNMAQRYSFKVGCLMYFEHYPFDRQNCVFSMALMSSTDKEVNLRWDKEYGKDAIAFFKHIEPLQFKLGEPVTYMNLANYNGANYTYLYVDIHLVRRLTGSIINIFAPSTLIVAVSWVTFWIRVEAAPARVALSVTSLLTLCTQVQQNKSQLPPLNYITAVDIWLFVCILMVFCALVEFAFSYNSFMEHKVKNVQAMNNKETDAQSKSKVNPWMEDSDASDLKKGLRKFPQQLKAASNQCSYCCFPCNGAALDVFCRKLFPFCFLIFAIVYWVHFLNIYNYQ